MHDKMTNFIWIFRRHLRWSKFKNDTVNKRNRRRASQLHWQPKHRIKKSRTNHNNIHRTYLIKLLTFRSRMQTKQNVCGTAAETVDSCEISLWFFGLLRLLCVGHESWTSDDERNEELWASRQCTIIWFFMLFYLFFFFNFLLTRSFSASIFITIVHTQWNRLFWKREIRSPLNACCFSCVVCVGHWSRPSTKCCDWKTRKRRKSRRCRRMADIQCRQAMKVSERQKIEREKNWLTLTRQRTHDSVMLQLNEKPWKNFVVHTQRSEKLILFSFSLSYRFLDAVLRWPSISSIQNVLYSFVDTKYVINNKRPVGRGPFRCTHAHRTHSRANTKYSFKFNKWNDIVPMQGETKGENRRARAIEIIVVIIWCSIGTDTTEHSESQRHLLLTVHFTSVRFQQKSVHMLSRSDAVSFTQNH